MWAAAAVSPLARQDVFGVKNRYFISSLKCGCVDANSLVIIVVHRPSSHVFAPAESERRSTWLFQRRRHCNLTDAAFLEFQTPAENCSFLSFLLATASPPLEILSDHLSARIRPPLGSLAVKSRHCILIDKTSMNPLLCLE